MAGMCDNNNKVKNNSLNINDNLLILKIQTENCKYLQSIALFGTRPQVLREAELIRKKAYETKLLSTFNIVGCNENPKVF